MTRNIFSECIRINITDEKMEAHILFDRYWDVYLSHDECIPLILQLLGYIETQLKMKHLNGIHIMVYNVHDSVMNSLTINGLIHHCVSIMQEFGPKNILGRADVYNCTTRVRKYWEMLKPYLRPNTVSNTHIHHVSSDDYRIIKLFSP